MVVFVDLDRDALPQHHGSRLPLDKFPAKLSMGATTHSTANAEPSDYSPACTSPAPLSDDRIDAHEPRTQEYPNRNAFSAALSCYPIVKEIARSVDLNTLHALSRTCRQFHVNLAPFRHQLVRETLRCENEYIETLAEMLEGGAVISSSVKSVLRLLSRGGGESGRMTRGKVGKCARDMVGECRRCSKIVCRNCIMKPPPVTLKNRVRRLCYTCGTAPLSDHLSQTPPSEQGLHDDGGDDTMDEHVVASSAFARGPCTCEEAVWLCTQCGLTLRSSDTTYQRVWAWRTRYSTYLGGGLGTGIGEGCQGVKCGRGEACLAAQEIELEVDCEADEGSSDGSSSGHSPGSGQVAYNHHHRHHHHHHHHHHILQHQHHHDNNHDIVSTETHDEEEPGYFRQEIIGLGGVVKHKAKKRVTVGACVVEYEDERETGRYLIREENRSHRSWCGWCSRVIPAKSETMSV